MTGIEVTQAILLPVQTAAHRARTITPVQPGINLRELARYPKEHREPLHPGEAAQRWTGGPSE